jgi:hypothetical protein
VEEKVGLKERHISAHGTDRVSTLRKEAKERAGRRKMRILALQSMQYHKTFEWFSVRQRKSVKTNISHDAM